MTGSVQPFVVLTEEGETVRGPAGGPATFKARAKETNGTLTALESVIAPGEGPPLHVHIREDEMYYVIGGGLHFLGAWVRIAISAVGMAGALHWTGQTGVDVEAAPHGLQRFDDPSPTDDHGDCFRPTLLD